jgi:hypothetical protein
MSHAGAETESAHLGRIENPFRHSVDDPASPNMITGQDAFEFGSHVSASFESNGPKISPVGYAEVMERT